VPWLGSPALLTALTLRQTYGSLTRKSAAPPRGPARGSCSAKAVYRCRDNQQGWRLLRNKRQLLRNSDPRTDYLYVAAYRRSQSVITNHKMPDRIQSMRSRASAVPGITDAGYNRHTHGQCQTDSIQLHLAEFCQFGIVNGLRRKPCNLWKF